MKILTESDRIYLREILPTDKHAMFELDSDPEVHTFLGNHPVKTIEEAVHQIEFIRDQYVKNGVGRLAIIEKSTNEFVGWAGLKLMTTPVNNRFGHYDLGYRLIKRYWGKGFATEAAYASLSYGFSTLGITEIYAIADCRNEASKKVLEKSGLKCVEQFDYEGVPHHWFEITKDVFQELKRNKS
ncbi:GNAT family N-acetyltransferase [Pedobacter metabolipauper]|uniref:RimJ/RimL family protein N-acetyltransferase n=1 Tax=Pedobacter metabolipauper TaxID=425513 RepID=A0A4R6T0G6_9SPHI|nr:GNAT family N-acetyltransferase [Pedobacter metabolipauper]TDQ11902.1 RimJ/RimL family protein N-acetyltransferase [Pedobacter metabolipauper]